MAGEAGRCGPRPRPAAPRRLSSGSGILYISAPHDAAPFSKLKVHFSGQTDRGLLANDYDYDHDSPNTEHSIRNAPDWVKQLFAEVTGLGHLLIHHPEYRWFTEENYAWTAPRDPAYAVPEDPCPPNSGRTSFLLQPSLPLLLLMMAVMVMLAVEVVMAALIPAWCCKDSARYWQSNAPRFKQDRQDNADPVDTTRTVSAGILFRQDITDCLLRGHNGIWIRLTGNMLPK